MIDPVALTPNIRGSVVPLWVAGGSLLAYAAMLGALSFRLRAGEISREHALTWLAGGGIAAGAAYLLAMFLPHASRVSPVRVMVVAIAARLLVAAAPPMLESDYMRYLWDGAVTSHAINPYRYAPADVLAGTVTDQDREILADLASRGDAVLNHVNHPHLTTIYPPVAQGAFAAAYAVAPWSPRGLRVVFAVADAATAVLLSRLLRALSLPPSRLAVYAWNPLLLREVYSSLHMDVLLLPLIAGSLLAAIRARHASASVWLVVASAVKVWPIALLPITLRPMLGRWRRLGPALLACGLLAAVLWLPVFLVSHGHNSGFLAYGRGWQNNDGFFRAGIWITERLLEMLGAEPWHSHAIMRVVALTLVAGVVLHQSRTSAPDAQALVARCLWVVGAIFVLAPTQFPWYWMWCLPLLTLRPLPPLLLYAALLPLYYVQDRLIDPLAHWLQHAPVWLLLGLAGARWLASSRRAEPRPEIHRA
jgi:alpha-1,6-mannosyltransferase